MRDSPAAQTRCNPFAFPSDVDFAFGLLVAAIAGTSLLIYIAIANAFESGFQSQAAQNARCESQAGPLRQSDSLQDRERWLASFTACENPHGRPLGWVAAGMAVLSAGGAAIYLISPAWRIRRGDLVPLTADQAPEMVEELQRLCRVAGLTQEPAFVWNPLNMACSGLAFGLPGRRTVALSGGLSTKLWTDPDVFRAVVLHELTHLRNGDVDKAYSTVAIWWSFVFTALIPYALVGVPWTDPAVAPRRVLSLVALVVVVYLLRNAALRAREIYADVRASAWPPFAGGLGRALSAGSRAARGGSAFPGRPRAWLSRHPSPIARQDAVRDTSPLFGASFWFAAGTGMAGSLALVDVDAVLNLWVAAFVFASLIVGVAGLALWRSTCFASVRGEPVRGLWRTALGLAAGVAAGDGLSLSGTATIPAGFALTGAPLLVFDLVWYGLLLLGSVLFFRWVVACASALLPVATTRSSPRAVYLFGILPAVLVLAVGLEFLFSVAPIRSTGGILPGSMVAGAVAGAGGFSIPAGPYLDAALALAQLLLEVATSPLFYLAVQLLWAVPLAAWLGRRRAAPVVAATWALMDPAPGVLAGSLPAPLRPGLCAAAGILGGLLFGLVTLPVSATLLQIAPDGLPVWLLYGQSVFGVLLQAAVAVVLASSVRRLGAGHGLFGAFVCGCVIAIVALGAALLTLGPAPLRVQGFTAFTVTTYLNVAALVTVPAAVTASGLASWIRRAASLPDPAPARGLR